MKQDIGRLPFAAQAYIAIITLAGAAAVAFAVSRWEPTGLGQFAFYLVCGALSSNLKVGLPGLTGTLSINFLFILMGVLELNLPQTLAIGCVSGLVQLHVAARRRPRAVQMVFTCGSMAVCCALAYGAYHLPAAVRISPGMPFRLFWTTAVYYLANTLSVAAIVALTEGKRLAQLWKDNFFWTGPHYLAGAAMVAAVHAWNVYMGWHTVILVLPVAYMVYHSYRLYLGRLEDERRHATDLADLHLRTIEALALAIDARDGTTHDHLQRVQSYARELGREFGLPEDQRRALEAAALLHDIGKLAVPEHIISKPGRLTPEEFEKMKIHPLVGAEILESARFPYPVAPIVLAHHEKWNGTGYPFGLKGEEIPLGARILSVVDCLDALASDRQYRRALPLDEAMRSVAAESGTSFDARVVEVVERRYVELERIARAESTAASKLSTHVRVTLGEPAAGFEQGAPEPAAPSGDFLASIGAARQEFQMLFELSQDLGNSLRVDETLSLLASRLLGVVPYHGIAIYTVDGERLKTQYAAGDDAALFSSLEIPLGEGLSGWVVRNDRPIVNGNPSVEPGYQNDARKFSVLRSAISVPLSGVSGVIGALTLYHRDGNAYTRDHLRILLAVSSRAGLTIENALRFVKAEQTAVTDELTGLPNARSLFLHLDRDVAWAAGASTSLAVVVIDMNGFKQVNDSYGHLTGNQVLRLTAQAMRTLCRESDYVARMGGDEFVLVIPSIRPEAVGERLRSLSQLVADAGNRVCHADIVSLSAGVAYYPEDGSDAEQLLAKADARMYDRKRQLRAAQAGRVLEMPAGAGAYGNGDALAALVDATAR